jgi:hypothetical protein
MSVKPEPSPRVEQEINTPYTTSDFDDFVVTERVSISDDTEHFFSKHFRIFADHHLCGFYL